MKLLIYIHLLILGLVACAPNGSTEKDCSLDNSISSERLIDSETLSLTSQFSETIVGDKRVFTTNNIPNHKVAPFPNASNPNTIKAINETLSIDYTPSIASQLTSLQSDFGPLYEFGIALNGVHFDPVAAEPWPHTSLNDPNVNWDWNLEATTNNLGLDISNAHVQPSGKYHYHGVPSDYIETLKATGNEMVQVGWAADGFPVYYKYGYADANDPASSIIELSPSYQLKTGSRPGDGITAPCGEYSGKYVNDFEYVEGLGQLDEANGRIGVTPEFPNGTYYYVLTDDFPGIPRYLVGTPSNDFKLMP
ncbi:MAG: YHYH protein [Cyclobacteriaceae bacterium]|nr:YHYH protein [Cyclobacteriaceae bacterium]